MGKVADLERVVGDIHSHPRKIRKYIPSRLLSLVNNPSFSVGDLYHLIYETTDYYLMGLVDGIDNMMAFSTRESRSQVVDQRLVTQNIFERYWYENNGWKYLGRENDQWPYAEPARSNPSSSMDITRMIAARHHLVIYKGVRDGKLKRLL